MDDAPNTAAPLAVSHAADFYRRYPGEQVTFYTRVSLGPDAPGFRLQISLDGGLIPGDAICTTDGQVPRVAVAGSASGVPTRTSNHFLWEVPANGGRHRQYDYTIQAVVAHTDEDLALASRALIWPAAAGAEAGQPSETAEDDEAPAGVETVTVAVSAQGRYVKFLPALYQEDELMGRFLMLFESFWSPITSQINQMDVYFDPKLTQAELLPWLASWIGLALDERWPEDRRRQLLSSAVTLFRRRGTKRGLQDYLETFTGVRPVIIEHGANNLRLGRDARLGPSIALGTSNQPHTFQVSLTLPPVAAAANGQGEAERARLENLRRRMIETIIDAEKPAHTDYTLRLDIAEANHKGTTS